MLNEIQIEVLLHISTGTALAWKMDFRDREYVALRVSDENDLRFGAFSLDSISDVDSGPRYEPVRRRNKSSLCESARQRRSGRKRRTFRDFN